LAGRGGEEGREELFKKIPRYNVYRKTKSVLLQKDAP
jgi:hypothetical protein